MKRDIDLARQLLLDIEGRGMDCSVSVLRSDPKQDVEERVRYHLRLLIDAGLLAEVDRTSSGVPCVRLTYDGHELVELARSESRWREAKWACYDHTGGLSLTVIRALLVRGGVGGSRYPWTGGPRRGRFFGAAPDYVRRRPAYHVEPYRGEDQDWWTDDDVHYVRVRPGYAGRWRRNGVDLDGVADVPLEPTLPDELI